MKKKKPLPQIAELHAQADALLSQIARLDSSIQSDEAECGRKIDELRAAYARMIEPNRDRLAATIDTLVGLMKSSKAHLFAETDVVKLMHGSLLHTVDKRNLVFHGKKEAIIATLERLGVGFAEAVKVAKSYDRDIIREWPDDKIAQIGAERKPAEHFGYDLKK